MRRGQLDHNSNYFNRVKPALQSSESVNSKLSGSSNSIAADHSCHKCPAANGGRIAGGAQLRRSEQDIYGSKMSTRMQDTAKSAWRASKQFASSVITGGVGLSACRQCTRKRPSTSGSSESARQGGQAGGCGLAANDELGAEQHTSVIKVGATPPPPPPPLPQPRPALACNREASIEREQQQQQQQQQQKVQVLQNKRTESQANNNLISVDENNKLTIVTKFNDSECQGPNSSVAMAPVSNGSERSRCESSSSGRGSSSDAGSAGSQNGDEHSAEMGQPRGRESALAVCLIDGANQGESGNGNGNGKTSDEAQRAAGKRHKRRSSLFKANKVFSGSQVSLNKLKGFFFVSQHQQTCDISTKPNASFHSRQLQAAKLPQTAHLESSRLRCMELSANSGNSSPSMEAAKEEPSEHSGSRGQSGQVGQGGADALVPGPETHEAREEVAPSAGEPVCALASPS